MSDRGAGRTRNEDACVARGDLLLVADGMGGYAGGDVAARLAAETLAAPPLAAPPQAGAVRAAFERAHTRIREMAARHPGWQEMGTTLTAAWVGQGRLVVGHVGDSRAYLVRGGRATQLTQDHSVAGELMRDGHLTQQEARRHPQRHMLTRSLGGERAPEVDVVEVPLAPGDRLVLCTDGLTGALETDEIARMVSGAHSAREAADALLREAIRRQAPDDVTVVVAFVEADDLEGEAAPGSVSMS